MTGCSLRSWFCLGERGLVVLNAVSLCLTGTGEDPTGTGEDPTGTGEDPTGTGEDPTGTDHYPTPTVHYPTPTVHYPTPTVHYPTPTVRYPTPTVRYPTPTVRYPTREIHCVGHSLFALDGVELGITSQPSHSKPDLRLSPHPAPGWRSLAVGGYWLSYLSLPLSCEVSSFRGFPIRTTLMPGSGGFVREKVDKTRSCTPFIHLAYLEPNTLLPGLGLHPPCIPLTPFWLLPSKLDSR